MAVKFVGQKDLKISELKPHPDNPNRGDVDSIAESLEEFGQFRSVVALPDGTILGGHHVVEAAKRVGMDTVRVEIIDVDPKTARKIMLADNRLADLGLGADLSLLLDNLEELEGDLIGTGFDDEYLKTLEEALSGPPDLDDLEDEVNEEPSKPEDFYRRLTIVIDPRLATRWESLRKLYSDDTAAFASLLGKVPDEQPAEPVEA